MLRLRSAYATPKKHQELVPVSHKNIIYPAVGKEQTAKGGHMVNAPAFVFVKLERGFGIQLCLLM